jgi:hypothetical protein
MITLYKGWGIQIILVLKVMQLKSMKLIQTTFSYDGHCFLQIDFSISLEESGIVVECSGTEGGVARDTEALTLLDNPTTRNLFIDDLSEVSSWLW